MGKALEEAGHDVYALDSAQDLEGLEDPDVLELAISEERALVTANVGDFMALITELNASGRSHTGCICVPRSISNEEFGVVISGVRSLVEDTSQEEWINRVGCASAPAADPLSGAPGAARTLLVRDGEAESGGVSASAPWHIHHSAFPSRPTTSRRRILSIGLR